MLDVAGIDIDHPTQDHLTGTEIAFAETWHGRCAEVRTISSSNPRRRAFPSGRPILASFVCRLQSSRLRRQHGEVLALGNDRECDRTYRRGLLSQDFMPNPTYEEAGSIGKDLARRVLSW